jgi:hypothetical protein
VDAEVARIFRLPDGTNIAVVHQSKRRSSKIARRSCQALRCDDGPLSCSSPALLSLMSLLGRSISPR